MTCHGKDPFITAMQALLVSRVKETPSDKKPWIFSMVRGLNACHCSHIYPTLNTIQTVSEITGKEWNAGYDGCQGCLSAVTPLHCRAGCHWKRKLCMWEEDSE
jgi:hypothetical protein